MKVLPTTLPFIIVLFSSFVCCNSLAIDETTFKNFQSKQANGCEKLFINCERYIFNEQNHKESLRDDVRLINAKQSSNEFKLPSDELFVNNAEGSGTAVKD
uniref:Pepsin-I3 domain-containing protein n=1 Tax=Rhabditophanes sp. KR3021 TaxID=114890 RepID=A0AC35TV26_9BILA